MKNVYVLFARLYLTAGVGVMIFFFSSIFKVKALCFEWDTDACLLCLTSVSVVIVVFAI